MAKRGAGTELNHDNWDQEEESEEAGEFKKASEDQMKGRVVRKAKRRNLDEDQKKNVFAGFGGFSSSNTTAKDAFSFLSKPADGAEVKTGGFSFGSAGANPGGLFGSSTENKTSGNGLFGSSNENKTGSNGNGLFGSPANNSGSSGNGLFGSTTDNKIGSSGNGFSFGAASNGSGADAGKSSFSAFSFGGAAAEQKDDKPTDTDTNKEEVTVKDDPKATTPPTVTAPADDLFSKFKPSSGSWSCDVCMITNKAEQTKCQACETPNPKAAAAPADDLFAKFKSKSGNWSCDVCMISNDATKDKCVACETPKPGANAEAATTENKSAFSFGEGGGFKFGASTQPETSSSTISGFKFGASDSTDSKNSANGGFKFGSSEPSKPVEESGGFKFGSTETVKPTEDIGGFKFGSSVTTEPATGFKFGSGSPNTSSEKSDVFKSTEGEFKFSSNEKVGSKVRLEASDTPQTKSKKGEYLADLKALNIQVTNWIKSHVDGNPLVDLTPVFKDYEKHINEMRKKFNIQASISSTDKIKLNLEKNETNNDEAERKEVRKGDSEGTKEDEPKPFSFGLNQSGFGNLSSGFGNSASSFQFGFLNKDENKTEVTKSEEEDSVQAEQVVETVVEDDALYTKKCKLFYKKDGAYVERGLGNIHLKKTDESKLQVIVRADTALGNILLNIIMTEDIPLERVGKNNVMLICLPNPPIDPKAEAEPVTFLIRVKNGEDADELKNKLTELAKTEN